jgi:hypothetical protein
MTRFTAMWQNVSISPSDNSLTSKPQTSNLELFILIAIRFLSSRLLISHL